jgi:protein involved in polysaccharide export with SLBB domain
LRIFVTAIIAGSLLAAPSIARADTALHPGDKIEVTVFNHPELSAERTIDASGNIALPVAGTVGALNMGSSDLAAAIQNRLSAYVRDVAVEVKLDSQTSTVFIEGGPNGVVPYAPGMTLANVLSYLSGQAVAPRVDTSNAQQAAAQMLTPNAPQLDLRNGPIDFRHVSVLRDGQTLGPFDVVSLRETGASGPVLAPNDTIELVDKPIAVTVSGDVERPSIAHLNADEPLSQALTQAGGLAASSRIDELQLVRGGQSNLVSVGSAALSQPAQNGDQLIVPRAVHVDVLGNVAKPGDTMLRGSDSLVSAIYYAGGPAKFANLRAVQVIRSGKKVQYDLGKLQKGGSGENPQLADGDIVFVPQGSTFEWGDVWGALGSLGLFGVHL